jgi:hypothetical protein
MPPLERKHTEALYALFKDAALEDQRRYYQRAVKRNRNAAAQVNRLRALFALLTGLSSALAGLIVAYSVAGGGIETCNPTVLRAIAADAPAVEATQTPEEEAAIAAGTGTPEPSCTAINTVVPLLLVVAVVAPALGAAFTTLADLYQWDRLITVYDVALENLEVADAQSPVPSMDDLVYRAALRAYTEGTLSVMRDETAQWGQLIKTPESLDAFVTQEAAKAQAASDTAAQRASGRRSTPPSESGGGGN